MNSYPLDVALKASIGRITHGVSPAALGAAFNDWAGHIWPLHLESNCAVWSSQLRPGAIQRYMCSRDKE
ncbi:poly-beta-hydroxybutyrate polymerase N-terminal domain-containing protein [Pelomonas sp. Root1217]|uniref:poly-beta-hydroxybutyrate polymerase N-terminal domain-containing protein n=1 Tax=Pelomonas sp. Root1217 TaxID=1736430 RepID=UPI0009E8ADFB